ncbi:hypothetical protein FRC10_011691 [Ceratobasidium sp. 414]|nr:hypothetical protein FRC10_011691 [Ceratobasidium sp. 414]
MAGSQSIKDRFGPYIGIDLAAGSVGGAAQVIVGQPLDTIKTRAQIAPTLTRWPQKGPMDILTQTVRKEGFFALYKGNFELFIRGMASPLIGIAGVNSLLFASYAISKKIVSPFPDLSLPQIAAAGAMAGAANSILASPVEMFKVRMQGQYGAAGDKRLSGVFLDMWSDWGFRKGVMRGFWATVAREIPAYAGYATSKRTCGIIQQSIIPVAGSTQVTSSQNEGFKPGTGRISPCGHCSLAVLAVMCYWLACYPLDVVKSRVQLANAPPRGLDYIAQELRAIVREGGA